MSADAALALMIDLRLSTNDYKELRDNAKEYGCHLYPPYYLVQKVKEQSYPKGESITVYEFQAEIQLQALLDHTCELLCRTIGGIL
ncbi:hypothetical protein Y032_0278g1170 [Ancylostoma ceylanicum]|uniref:Uncharacterized protein n=1 Tax=Ancylostoma ceylanicum TaxID=53326 RepID=A0A016S8A5_9BILA|nr:hypothetical protein Y032_0278g1170 [Ancylostoma ceylanicum]